MQVSDPADQQDVQPSGKRGEAAWKEHRDRIAARNDQARKEGRARREAAEREKNEARRDRERRQMATLLAKQGRP
jgi:hypothetical protein